MNKKIILNFVLLIFGTSVVLFSCIKDTGSLPKPPETCDTITYAKHIAPIVAQKCTKSCHNAGNPSGSLIFDAETFKAKAMEGRIEARVIQGNPSIMPPLDPDTAISGPLKQSHKDLITCWLKNGYKP